MKNFTIIMLVALIALVAVGCDNAMINDYIAAGFTLEALGVDASAASRSISSRSVNTNGIKAAFRSSDIEFWSTGGNFTNLVSEKYVNTGDYDYITDAVEGQNVSQEIELSNSTNNVVFMPNTVSFGDVYEMPAFENKVYDVVRMDIGGGNIQFFNGVNALKLGADGDAAEGIDNLDVNSIILIDNTVLTEIVYVPRNEFDDPNTGNTFVDNFIVDNVAKWYIDEVGIDMDGALFIPFDAIDFTNKGNINKLKIRVEWDMASIFDDEAYDEVNDIYTLNDDADGTPYDFDIEVEIN